MLLLGPQQVRLAHVLHAVAVARPVPQLGLLGRAVAFFGFRAPLALQLPLVVEDGPLLRRGPLAAQLPRVLGRLPGLEVVVLIRGQRARVEVLGVLAEQLELLALCLLYTSPSPRD